MNMETSYVIRFKSLRYSIKCSDSFLERWNFCWPHDAGDRILFLLTHPTNSYVSSYFSVSEKLGFSWIKGLTDHSNFVEPRRFVFLEFVNSSEETSQDLYPCRITRRNVKKGQVWRVLSWEEFYRVFLKS